MNAVPNEFGPGQEDCLYLNVFTPDKRDEGEFKKVSLLIYEIFILYQRTLASSRLS